MDDTPTPTTHPPSKRRRRDLLDKELLFTLACEDSNRVRNERETFKREKIERQKKIAAALKEKNNEAGKASPSPGDERPNCSDFGKAREGIWRQG